MRGCLGRSNSANLGAEAISVEGVVTLEDGAGCELCSDIACLRGGDRFDVEYLASGDDGNFAGELQIEEPGERLGVCVDSRALWVFRSCSRGVSKGDLLIGGDDCG